MRILVADGSKDNSGVIADSIRRLYPDAECTASADYSEAAELCRSGAFDVFVIGISFPAADGIFLAGCISERFPASPVVCIAADKKDIPNNRFRRNCAFISEERYEESLDLIIGELRGSLPDYAGQLLESEYSGNAVIGKQIKKRRKDKAVTKKELAELMGVSLRTVYRWESGDRVPDIVTIMKLAHVLGITADDLLGYDMFRQEF